MVAALTAVQQPEVAVCRVLGDGVPAVRAVLTGRLAEIEGVLEQEPSCAPGVGDEKVDCVRDLKSLGDGYGDGVMGPDLLRVRWGREA